MSKISPQFTTESFGANPTLNQKILIFEARELGWRFHIAEATEQIPHAGYAVISILFAYFEMFQQYSSGVSSDNGSKAAFRACVRLVYPAYTFTDDQLNTIYSRVRCGMFHNGYSICVSYVQTSTTNRVFMLTTGHTSARKSLASSCRNEGKPEGRTEQPPCFCARP